MISLKNKIKNKKGFTLVEIIIAVVIFLVIILIFIQVFSSVIQQNKASIEKARMNEYLSLIEKTIKDELNASNLEVPLDTWESIESSIDIDNNNNNIDNKKKAFINPHYFPTCVIQPNIFQREVNLNQNPLIYIYPDTEGNTTINRVAALSIEQNNILSRVIHRSLNPQREILPVALVNLAEINGRRIRWYYVFKDNQLNIALRGQSYIFQEQNALLSLKNFLPVDILRSINLLDLSRQVPSYDRNGRYQFEIIIQRIPIRGATEILTSLHGTYWDNLPNGAILTDPINLIINMSIWINNPRSNRRILELKRTFLVTLKYKRVI